MVRVLGNIDVLQSHFSDSVVEKLRQPWMGNYDKV